MVIQRRHHLSRQRSALTSVAGRTPNTMQSAGSGGKKFGRIDSDITISGDTLTLTNGLIDTGFCGVLPMVNGLIIRNQRTAERKTARRKLMPPQNFLASRRPYASRHLMWITIYTLAQSTLAAR
ncbi:hypothetical protein ACLBOM_06005 [Escherichia coli]